MVQGQGVIPQSAAFLEDVAANPRKSPVVYPKDSAEATPGDQSLIAPPRSGVEIVAGLIKLAGHLHQANTVSDTVVTP